MSTPPIIFISSDQHRADSLGCSGHPCVRTPHLDKLAAGGLRFDRAYADCPVCIPQRTTWLTGVKSHTYGKPDYAEHYRMDYPRERMLGSLMSRAGYQTALIGKTHWHTEPSFRGGFETVIRDKRLAEAIRRRVGRPGATFSGIGFNELHPGPSHVPPELYSSDWLVDQALDFLEHRDRTQAPFLWLSLTDPHPPNTIHEPYYSMYDGAGIPAPVRGDWTETGRPFSEVCRRESWNYPRLEGAALEKARAVYYGKITNLDHQLGRLFGKLQVEGLFDRAWIVYTSDHGEFLGDHDLIGKRSFLEASARVPLIVRPPTDFAAEPGRRTEALVCLDDLLPTFCAIAGTAAPEGVTGKSWMPLLDDTADRLHEFQHGNIAGSHMYHDGRYKYLYDSVDGSELVFDTAEDPGDLRDLSADETLTARLRQAFAAHLEAEGHPHWQDGAVLNEGREPPPLHRLRAATPNGWRAIGDGTWPV